MRLILILFLLWIPEFCYSQLKLNKNAYLDTLFLDITIGENIPELLRDQLLQSTDLVIQKFNGEKKHKFVVVNNPESLDRKLIIDIQDIAFVTRQQQTGAFVGSLLGLSLPIILAAAQSPIIIAFWFIPMNKVDSEYGISEDLRAKNYKDSRGIFSCGGGWVRSPENNRRKFVANYEYVLYRTIVRIDKKTRR